MSGDSRRPSGLPPQAAPQGLPPQTGAQAARPLPIPPAEGSPAGKAGARPTPTPLPPAAAPIPARPQPIPSNLPPAAPQPIPGGLPPTSKRPSAPAPLPKPAAPQPIPATSKSAAGRSLPPSAAPQPLPQPAAPRPLPASASPAAPQPLPAGAAPRPALAEGENVRLRSKPTLEATPEEKIKKFAIRNSPPWVVSLAVHLLVIVILGVWIISKAEDEAVFLEATYSDVEGQQLEDASISLEQDQLSDAVTLAPQVVSDPFSAPPKIELADIGAMASSSIQAPTVGVALAGRETGMRQALLGRYGGNQHTEEAVQLALEWLAKNQRPDGLWSLKGPYKDGAQFENNEAATAMALLAFQGAGNTHRTGKFARNVDRGIKALIRLQKSDGDFFQQGVKKDEWLYAQAQCTMAICELLAMSRDSALREPARRAVEFCVAAQEPRTPPNADGYSSGGGWRYTPRRDSDTSVTGWMVMALQSARMAGFDVPDRVFEDIGGYLDGASDDDGALYGYQTGVPPDRVMTAEGLLCRQYLGWRHDDERLIRGAQTIMRQTPQLSDRDVYYWYYATQLMHHMEGEYWSTWNGAQRDLLTGSQVKTGPERGSWEPLGEHPDRWCQLGHGGRLYVTCLSTYMLEVYYRHLPLYSDLKKQITRIMEE